jgi:SH3-like domain-containing protein
VPPATPTPAPGPAPQATPAEGLRGSSTNLPLPRFASLKSEEVNFRTGPGLRYPIEWVYKRRDLPVLIEREFDVWRLVRDPEGTRGWVHVANLTPRRGMIVTGGERVLRRQAADDAAAVARLQPGVVGQLRSCREGAEWCQVQVGPHRGWLRRNDFWGTLPGEAVN